MYLDKGIPCFGRIRFDDLTLKPRLTEHQDRQTDRRSVFFFLHVAIRNSLRSDKFPDRLMGGSDSAFVYTAAAELKFNRNPAIHPP